MTFCLINLLIVLLLIPTTEEAEITQKSKCDIHKWVSKESGYEGVKYTVCEKCKFLPGSNDFEA